MGGLGGGLGWPSSTQLNWSVPRPGDPAGIAPCPSRCPLPCQVPGSAFHGVLVHSDLGSSTVVRVGPQYRTPFSPGENQSRILQLRKPLPPFCAVFLGLLLGLCVRVPRCLAPRCPIQVLSMGIRTPRSRSWHHYCIPARSPDSPDPCPQVPPAWCLIGVP